MTSTRMQLRSFSFDGSAMSSEEATTTSSTSSSMSHNFMGRRVTMKLVMIAAMSVGILMTCLHLSLDGYLQNDHNNADSSSIRRGVRVTTSPPSLGVDVFSAATKSMEDNNSNNSNEESYALDQEEEEEWNGEKEGKDWLEESSESNDAMNLVVCTRVRNEAPYLREWIEYHRMIGFSSFLILNDQSTDDTQCILNAYAEQGVVVRIPQDFGNNSIDVHNQGATFDACVEYLKRELTEQEQLQTWMLSHDVDEFVWFNNQTASSLKDAIHLLSKGKDGLGNVQSMRVPRLLFGSSGHDYFEPLPVIDRFDLRYDAGSCPPKASQKSKRRHRHRRRLFNHQSPTSYCDNNNPKLYDEQKSMSLLSAIAQDCYDKIDPVTDEKRVARCTGPHNHELLNPNGGPTKSKSYLAADDSRYLDALDILDTMAMMHYMTRSRQEFFQRTCGSQFAQKYLKCEGCSPETYFNLTETYANLLQDHRMMPMAEKLKVVLATAESSTTVAAQCDESHPPVKPWDDYRACWFAE